MADPAAALTAPVAALAKAPAAFWDVAKKYWLAALIAIGIFGLLIMRWRVGLEQKISKTPKVLKSIARVGGFLVPFGLLLLGGEALAATGQGATCCAEPAAALSWWQAMLALLAGPIAFGISMFSSPDILDGKTTNKGKSLSFTPSAAKQDFSMFIKCPNKRTTSSTPPAPLLAIDTTIALETTVNNLTTGTAAIEDDDLARLLDYLEIESPTIGTVLDQKTGTGPVLNLVIEFLAMGFNRSVAPIASIAVGSGTTRSVALTKYWTYPWCQRFLDDPSLSCPWLGIIDETELKMNWAVTSILGGVSTGSTYSGASTVRVGTSYISHTHWFQPWIAKYFVNAPTAGTDGLEFTGFGSALPQHTIHKDLVFAIGQLSNLKGLPGNMTINNILKIIAPAFGLDDVSNIDMLVSERLKAQISGRTPDMSFSNGGNHKIGTVADGMSLDDLLFLLLRQPSLNMDLRNMLLFDSKTKLEVREEMTSVPSTQHAFLLGSLRQLDIETQQSVKETSGGRMPLATEGRIPFTARK
jgi:hypothetical protein